MFNCSKSYHLSQVAGQRTNQQFSVEISVESIAETFHKA